MYRFINGLITSKPTTVQTGIKGNYSRGKIDLQWTVNFLRTNNSILKRTNQSWMLISAGVSEGAKGLKSFRMEGVVSTKFRHGLDGQTASVS
ncbi:unnamed protein product [Allacma fusca]|uniref:Uncharacterized protein n=1 Tax=Allacma fusca TaxID=39272 RepID=A0A8J2KB90_9HEXA|nr:unnamed protein product [Allacma fusca]